MLDLLYFLKNQGPSDRNLTWCGTFFTNTLNSWTFQISDSIWSFFKASQVKSYCCSRFIYLWVLSFLIWICKLENTATWNLFYATFFLYNINKAELVSLNEYACSSHCLALITITVIFVVVFYCPVAKFDTLKQNSRVFKFDQMIVFTGSPALSTAHFYLWNQFWVKAREDFKDWIIYNN